MASKKLVVHSDPASRHSAIYAFDGLQLQTPFPFGVERPDGRSVTAQAGGGRADVQGLYLLHPHEETYPLGRGAAGSLQEQAQEAEAKEQGFHGR